MVARGVYQSSASFALALAPLIIKQANASVRIQYRRQELLYDGTNDDFIGHGLLHILMLSELF